MKILKLEIRNLASIVEATIDFEHDPGLIDPATGQPAQRFLIYGDTGTGKSVLLDAIAMALFGTTPRIEEVPEQKMNSYLTSDGSQINLFGLEQYTRIGISPQAECYSRVEFLGNDGVLYRATRLLGRTSRGNYRNDMRLQRGDEPEIGGVRQCEEIIQKAIGMTFDQFCRMAMLAQGQFTAFLCGKKEQRADILEKLTGTGHFSRYGEAISNIYKAKSDALKVKEKLLEEERQRMLPAEQVEALAAQREQLSTECDTLDSRLALLSTTLARLDQVSRLQADIQKASLRKAEIEQQQESDDYRSRQQLVADWDATPDQRQAYTDRQKAQAELAQLQAQMETFQGQYATLAASLRQQEEQLSLRQSSLAELQHWLAERIDRDELFSNSKEAVAYLKQHSDLSAKLKRTQEQLSATKLQEKPLAEALQAAQQQAAIAGQQVEAKQQQIDAVNAQRQALNPEQIAHDIEQQRQQQQLIDKADENLGRWRQAMQEAEQKQQEMLALAPRRTTLADQKSQCQQAYEAATQLYNQALGRYTTLNASLDETLTSLRNRMVENSVDTCPLCGGHVDIEGFNHQHFEQLLIPLKQERDDALARQKEAQGHYEAAAAALATFDGTLSSLRKSYEEHLAACERQQTAVQKSLEALNLSFPADKEAAASLPALQEQLMGLHGEVTRQLQRLGECQAKAAELLQQREVLLQEKQLKDSVLAQANKTLSEAQHAEASNRSEAARLASQQADLHREAAILAKRLDTLLLPHYPWQPSPEQAAQQLSADAQQYLQQKQEQISRSIALAAEQETIGRLRSQQAALRQLPPSWQEADPPVQLMPLSEQQQRWDTLVRRHAIASDRIQNLTAQLRTFDEQLSEWCAVSGHSLGFLGELIAQRDQVEPTRRALQQSAADLQSTQQLLATLAAQCQQVRAEIAPADESLPDPAALTAEQSAATERSKELHAQLQQIAAQLLAQETAAQRASQAQAEADGAAAEHAHWKLLNQYFGGRRFRLLVQSYIMHPLLNNANLYLRQITDRYTLTCSPDNEQLSVLVRDEYNRGEVRSATVLSGGERFMVSLALSLALSSLKKGDMNVNILFIDEGFGTLDQECLDSVMHTLECLSQMPGQQGRRVGIITHREELVSLIPNKIKVSKVGEGRSKVSVRYEM